MLKGAFIGFGNVAANGHMPGWRARDDVRIIAATDAAAQREQAFLADCPDGRWHETVDDLLSGEKLDFVDICAPPGSHAPLIERALDAGLHVLSEKPLVTRAEDAERVAGAAARSGRVLHTVHNWLCAPVCRKITALVEDGADRARAKRPLADAENPAGDRGQRGGRRKLARRPEQAGGGILSDHGWHALYCVTRWAGAPDSVVATLETRRFHDQPLEDTASVDLVTAGGVSNIFLTWAADERSNRIEIEGERGEIRVIGDALILKSRAGERRWTSPSLSEGSHHPDWFGGVAADFVAAATGAARSNLEEALLCARLIDAAQRSSAAGGARVALAG